MHTGLFLEVESDSDVSTKQKCISKEVELPRISYK